MKPAPIPENEEQRQQAIDKLNIVYSPAEDRFDRITRIAMRLFDVPIALVSLVSRDKQWFKSCQGLSVAESGRDISFCGHAIMNDDVLVIPNASKDPDFLDNPMVTGPPNIRFYAGQPLRFEEQRIGTLCIIDQRPRHLSPSDYDSLRSLGAWVETELVLWNQHTPGVLRQLLAKDDKAKLVDPVTGGLTEQAIEIVKGSIETTAVNDPQSPGPDQPSGIRIEVGELVKLGDLELINLARKEVAQVVRSAIGDLGVLGLDGKSRYAVVLSPQGRLQLPALLNRLQVILARLNDSKALQSAAITIKCHPF